MGVGIWVNAATLSAVGLTPAEEMLCPSKSALVALSLALTREKLRCVFGGVGIGLGCCRRGKPVCVENDDVVEVGGDASKVFEDLVDDLDEPPGRGTAALRHDEPFEKPGGCAEHGEGNGIFIDGDLVERGYKVEQGEDESFSQGIEDLVDVGDGELSEGADRVKLIVVDRNTDAAIFAIAIIGLEYGEVECWMRPAARYWSSTASTFLAKMGLMRYGRAVKALSGGTEILNGIREQEPNSFWMWRRRRGIRKGRRPKC